MVLPAPPVVTNATLTDAAGRHVGDENGSGVAHSVRSRSSGISMMRWPTARSRGLRGNRHPAGDMCFDGVGFDDPDPRLRSQCGKVFRSRLQVGVTDGLRDRDHQIHRQARGSELFLAPLLKSTTCWERCIRQEGPRDWSSQDGPVRSADGRIRTRTHRVFARCLTTSGIGAWSSGCQIRHGEEIAGSRA